MMIKSRSIKLCYEELEKYDLRIVKSKHHPKGRLALYEGVPHHKTNIPSTVFKDIKGYCEETVCVWCGELFLNCSNMVIPMCSLECKNEFATWRREWKKLEDKLIRKKKATLKRVKADKAKTIANEKSKIYWEKTNKGKKNALYKRYIQLKPYYEIRKALDDEELLETKCALCGEWFKPRIEQLKDLRSFVNGTLNSKKQRTTLYCSESHGRLMQAILNKIKKGWKTPKKTKDEYISEYYNYVINLNNIKIAKVSKERKILKRKNNIIKRNELKIIKQAAHRLKTKENAEYRKTDEYKNKMKVKWLKRYEKLRQNDPKEFKLRRLLAYSKVRAKEKNIPHSIDKNWLLESTKYNMCELTGIIFDYDTTIQRNPFGPSIDRIDVSKGYTPDNCRMVIWAVNAGLCHYTEKDLYTICKAYLNKKRKEGCIKNNRY